jgi:hypothetical protein
MGCGFRMACYVRFSASIAQAPHRISLGVKMKPIIGGVVAPLVAFAVLSAGAPGTSATGTGESHPSTAGGVLLLSGSVNMASKPKPPQLSEEERRAIENKKAGRPYEKTVYEQARQKQVQGDKYNQHRNKQKRRK